MFAEAEPVTVEAPVDITYGNLAGGCHVSLYAAP
jgi:hypothetical protein